MFSGKFPEVQIDWDFSTKMDFWKTCDFFWKYHINSENWYL